MANVSMFEEFWCKYPRKVAKKAAEKAYAKAVKTIPHAAIMASLDLMLATEWRGREPQYIPHCASWLNREEFQPIEERTEALEDERQLAFDGPQKHYHWCAWQSPEHPGHSWECTEDLCIWPGHMDCSVRQRRENFAVVAVRK